MAVPNAVVDLVGVAGDGQVALSWTAPLDGGSAITDYIVQYRIVSGGGGDTMIFVDLLGNAIVDSEGKALVQ
jgi:hypothetical protein